MRRPAARALSLGLRANAAQFGLLVGVNALVGGVAGQERTIMPLLAREEFGLTGYRSLLGFIVAFGLSKAVVNYFAGALADRYGRKPVLLAGWLFAIPVPLLIMWAPSWGWILFANVLLGINQGLAWSVTIIMKIDLVGPRLRGTAMGFNEAAGYGAIALAAWATGAIAESAGLRPAPFLLGLAFAALGLGLSTAFVRETAGHAALEAAALDAAHAAHDTHAANDQARWPAEQPPARMPARHVFALSTWGDRTLAAASRTGLVNNLNDGAAWGLFPVLFAAGGMDLASVGLLSAIAPAVWGVGQLGTGALSDRIGRKRLIVGGQLIQAAGLAVVAAAGTAPAWAAGSALLGAGTAMAYPTLIATVSDVADPRWRGAAVGVYRLWRDVGFAAGAVLAGLVADRFSVAAAIQVVAVVTAASGLDAALHLRETHPASGRAARGAAPVS